MNLVLKRSLLRRLTDVMNRLQRLFNDLQRTMNKFEHCKPTTETNHNHDITTQETDWSEMFDEAQETLEVQLEALRLDTVKRWEELQTAQQEVDKLSEQRLDAERDILERCAGDEDKACQTIMAIDKRVLEMTISKLQDETATAIIKKRKLPQLNGSKLELDTSELNREVKKLQDTINRLHWTMDEMGADMSAVETINEQMSKSTNPQYGELVDRMKQQAKELSQVHLVRMQKSPESEWAVAEHQLEEHKWAMHPTFVELRKSLNLPFHSSIDDLLPAINTTIEQGRRIHYMTICYFM